MKSAIIAKVAAQASDLYREAHQACEVTNVRQQLEKVNHLLHELISNNYDISLTDVGLLHFHTWIYWCKYFCSIRIPVFLGPANTKQYALDCCITPCTLYFYLSF